MPRRGSPPFIVGTLGRGAMGTVYDGRDPVIDRRVAIKTIPLASAADDAEAAAELARFKREAQAAGRLQHPNIVGVYDYGETDTLAYIVMEFVDGTSLKALLDRGERMAPSETVRVMQQLLAALQYSHEHGVVHRDIKPANVMITAGGLVKIADFGIARIESSSLTQAGTIMGTPAYMSPEQFMGQTVDARTDIYSAGVLLYQLLTGERPFEGSMTAIMHKALNTAPPRPSEISVTSPPGLDAVVATAMAKRPEQRFQTAAAFSAALADGLAAAAPEPDSDATLVVPARVAAGAAAPVLPPASAAAMPPARRRAPLMAGAALAAVLAAGVAGYVALRPGPLHGPDKTAATTAAADAPAAVSPPTAATTASKPPAAVATAAALPPAPAMPAPSAPAASTPTPSSTATPSEAAAPASLPPVAPAATERPPAAPAPTAVVPAVAASPEPAAPKPVEVAAANIPAALRAAIRSAIAPVGCALLGGDVSGDRVQLDGIVARGNEANLSRAVADAAPGASQDWHVATFTGPYCSLLDVLRPITPAFARAGSGLQVGLKGGNGPLRKDAYLIPQIAMPGWPAYLTLDYFTSDGGLAHLYPAATDRAHEYPAHASVVIGDPSAGAKGWQVDVPFGTDLMVAIASAKPLFARPRPDDETADAYLRALKAALDAAARQGERVAASATVVQTVAK